MQNPGCVWGGETYFQRDETAHLISFRCLIPSLAGREELSRHSGDRWRNTLWSLRVVAIGVWTKKFGHENNVLYNMGFSHVWGIPGVAATSAMYVLSGVGEVGIKSSTRSWEKGQRPWFGVGVHH